MTTITLYLIILSTMVGIASAFVAPSSTTTAIATTTTTTVLASEKVPCFGAAPFLGDTKVFFGENYWNKLTSEYGTEGTGTFLRAAYVVTLIYLHFCCVVSPRINQKFFVFVSYLDSELKHGRAAMMATVGFAFEKFGITFDKFSPHEYLSVTQGIKFADLAAMNPLEAIQAVPVEGLVQVFGIIAAIEFYELTHRDGRFILLEDSMAPGLQGGGLTGDLGWNPLQIKVDDRRRLVELQNGRSAMFAITAWVAAEAIPGSVPLPLPW